MTTVIILINYYKHYIITYIHLFIYGHISLRFNLTDISDLTSILVKEWFQRNATDFWWHVLFFPSTEEAHQAGQGLLIHCQAGVSRSATIVIAYLMKHTWMTMTDAYKFVKSRRPIISPNLNFMGQLLEFEEDLNNGITPRILTPKLTGLETVV